MNPAFHQPVVCVVLGLLLIATSFILLIVFSIKDDLSEEHGKSRDISVALTCIMGALFTLIGCCVCCSRRESIKHLWNESMRRQGLHRISRIRQNEDGGNARPIVTGYDPRTSMTS